MIDIPENKESCNMTREERVDAIASVLLKGHAVRTTVDARGRGWIIKFVKMDPKDGEEKEWFDTETGCERPDPGCERIVMFLPVDSEVNDALEQFRQKGWHAYYDTELQYYRVCNVHFQVGGYADRFMNWLF